MTFLNHKAKDIATERSSIDKKVTSKHINRAELKSKLMYTEQKEDALLKQLK